MGIMANLMFCFVLTIYCICGAIHTCCFSVSSCREHVAVSSVMIKASTPAAAIEDVLLISSDDTEEVLLLPGPRTEAN